MSNKVSGSFAAFNSCDHKDHLPSLCPHLGIETLSAEQAFRLDLDMRLKRIESMLVDMFELGKETCDKVDDIQEDINAMMFDDDGAEVEGEL